MSNLKKFGQGYLVLLVMMSGFFGLSYEILFTRTLTTLFGSIFYVSAGVMAAFFIGVGISAFFSQRLYKFVGMVEICIGLMAFAFGLCYQFAVENSGFFFSLIPSSEFLIFLIPFLITLAPSLIIGCSLPMLYELYQRVTINKDGFSGVFAAYNLGALACVLIIEVVLVRIYGISATLLCLGIINTAVGSILHFETRKMASEKATSDYCSTLSDREKGLAASLFVSSIAFGMFQVFGLKIMGHVWGATASNVAAVIGSALIGSAAGAYLFSKIKISLSTVLLFSIPAITFSMLMIEPISWLWAQIAYDINIYVGPYWTFFMQSIMVFVLLTPAYIFIGPTESVAKSFTEKNSSAGLFIGITSIGNAIGIVLLTLFLHENFQDHVTFIIISSIIAISAFMSVRSERKVYES